jgi:hypothetical protein
MESLNIVSNTQPERFIRILLCLFSCSLEIFICGKPKNSKLQAYGLASLSPQAWMNVVNTFQTNDTLWQQYYRFWRGEYPHLKPCTGPCKKTMICEILSIEPQQFFECNSNQLSTTKQTTDQLPQTHTRRSLQNQKG